ncbi:MAG: inorganic phosphate transporter, PiT family [Solirubrobacteraceae bacterium]|jgi:PiT family inorganic phosphate transporter|nr:inorganic phosphate transporter, PiT family [Solirubrobacteraceae bacterium]MEA2137917.1 inorganic phosphate transporter, PiT family [Solirubrobacteraceae bacterium]
MDAALAAAVALAFAFAITNGLHDASNAIATLVATRAARPRQALVLAAVFNLLGPLLVGAAVASAIGGIVTIDSSEAVAVIGAGLLAAVAWNVLTWRLGLPSSSGHALVGGLVGAALLAGGAGAVRWGGMDGIHPVGVLGACAALALSPPLGALAAFVLVRAVRRGARRASRRWDELVKSAQWATSATLAFSHGANDAQKSVGVIAALLLADGRTQTFSAPLWVKIGCAAALTLGTAAGGWSIVRTVGRRIYHLHPVDGLCSQGASAAVILGASFLGAPTSTTQVVASSVVGVGAGRRRWHHVRWTVVRQMALGWIVTMPATAAIGALTLLAWRSAS